MKAEEFAAEIKEAVANYDRYIVCIDKTPDEMQDSVMSLMTKAIKVYENRAPGLKHGIALDNQVTIILSEPPQPAGVVGNGGRPLVGIYFNLHSPYKPRRGKSGN